ncbi:MAG: M28 family peptidase [Anaerolineae bacterium]
MKEQILDEFSIDRAWEHVLWLTENAPQRISGSEDERTAASYFKEKMDEYGLVTQVDVFDGYNSFPVGAELKITSPQEREIDCAVCCHIASTPPQGIQAELVYVGAGGVDDYVGKDVQGKAVLAEISYAPPRPEKARIAAAHGAVALILMNWGLPEHGTMPLGAIKGVWGNPTPETMKQIPRMAALGITRRDGEYLRDLCQQAEVRVWLRAEATQEWGPLHQPWGHIPGAVEPEKYLLVAGHFDAWRPGVTDNATGNATKLELARIFAQHRSELRRGILFAFWTGHEIGDMEGSTWFLDNNWEDLNQNCTAYFNVDTVGMKGTTRYIVTSSAELIRFHQGVERELFGKASTRRRLSRTGDQSFLGIGIPSLYGQIHHTPEEIERWHNATLGWWWHSSEDTLDKVDKELFARVMRTYAAYISAFCTAPFLPVEFMSVADELEGRLKELQSQAGHALDLSAVVTKAQELREAASRLDQFVVQEEAAAAEEDIQPVNECLMRLSRILTPVSTTVVGKYGQDSYGLTAMTKPIPGLYEAGELGTLDSAEEAHKLLLTKLVRERNKVSDALSEARWHIDNLLRQGS